MTETRAVSIDDVRTLVGERQRYDDWLAALDGRRADTPARVFERVHGDYSARRTAVMERLRSHVSELAELADDLDIRLTTLEDGMAMLEDERIEAMLRTAVGEFDDDRWEQVRQDVEAKIAERTGVRSALLVEVDDVRTLLSSARSEPAVAKAADIAPVASGGAEKEADAVALPEPVRLAERVTDADVTPVDLQVVDEPSTGAAGTNDAHRVSDASDTLDIEDALALFTPSPAPDARSVAPIDTTGIEIIGNSPDATSADPFDDLAFLRSVTESPAESASRATHQPSQGTGPSMHRASQSSSQLSAQQAATATSPSSEAQKTLRCTECGTMNLPTEWYCERCGGELAAF